MKKIKVEKLIEKINENIDNIRTYIDNTNITKLDEGKSMLNQLIMVSTSSELLEYFETNDKIRTMIYGNRKLDNTNIVFSSPWTHDNDLHEDIKYIVETNSDAALTDLNAASNKILSMNRIIKSSNLELLVQVDTSKDYFILMYLKASDLFSVRARILNIFVINSIVSGWIFKVKVALFIIHQSHSSSNLKFLPRYVLPAAR